MLRMPSPDGGASVVWGEGGGGDLGLGVFEGVEEVDSGVVVGFGGQTDPGGVGALSDCCGFMAGVAYSRAS
jgi:hypothetical protein